MMPTAFVAGIAARILDLVPDDGRRPSMIGTTPRLTALCSPPPFTFVA
jgi:hypothetical protein